MSAKGIFEAKGKGLLNAALGEDVAVANRYASVCESTNWAELEKENPWLLTTVCLLKLFI